MGRREESGWGGGCCNGHYLLLLYLSEITLSTHAPSTVRCREEEASVKRRCWDPCKHTEASALTRSREAHAHVSVDCVSLASLNVSHTLCACSSAAAAHSQSLCCKNITWPLDSAGQPARRPLRAEYDAFSLDWVVEWVYVWMWFMVGAGWAASRVVFIILYIFVYILRRLLFTFRCVLRESKSTKKKYSFFPTQLTYLSEK